MGHRGGASFAAGTRGNWPGANPSAAAIDPRDYEGFSYLLGTPPDDKRSALGASTTTARALFQALHSLLPIGASQPNTRIPAGYTYLLQMVAHDLVETTVPFWAAAEAGVASRNMRGATLALDTLYGGGPTACPVAFQPNGDALDARTQLRIGRVADAAAQGACPFRDLARLVMPDPVPAPSNVDQVSQVFVADPRNDDNTIISQLTVLLSTLHNAIAGRLRQFVPQAQFAHARTALLQMYYAVIRNDLLPRLLHPQVLAKLQAQPADSDAWLWHGGALPLEFSHGAFRVGHGMVRPFYKFNDQNTFNLDRVIGGPIVGQAVREPLPAIWVIAWSKFYQLAGEPNYSLKLAVRQRLPIDEGGVLPDIAANTPDNLTLRDWLSWATARTWRLDAMIDAVSQHYPDLPYLRTAGITSWLQQLLDAAEGMQAEKALVSQNLAALAQDLPLPLYVLLEAQQDPAIAGAHMGPLGSILVGEVLFRRLAEGEARLQSLVPAAQQAIGATDWGRIAAVTSMPDLVRLTEDWGELGNCPALPFIAA